ncbi:MAG: T9SS type A sorting domain-containing protein [Bacteroidetes bacterium]|nr:T9SS type A sorting domain-containing protein [Bacteroidota bacterium]
MIVVRVDFRNENQIQIFPNPTSGELEIVGEELEGATIKIFDNMGKQVQSLILSKQELDISDLPNGMYFIQINQEGRLFESKIIKE